ncbi:MAG: hypothetical protein KME25_09520 [Symplocastrum torsivum CPER-KK1]|uniref:Glycosyl hydrolases family 39 N-terminal catalytic domain-containing protein n=1 Tax=Symplocastrum torsivum CPER-KK1 TaxID=450513 RepID=A0A951UAL8_9CYAN|nr:hypothetical protein [Symplocastrum torsivum CPER-KK1]
MRHLQTRFWKLLGLALTSSLLVVFIYTQPSFLKDIGMRLSGTQAAAVSTKPIPQTYFGMHIAEPFRIPWPAVPIGSWRLWDTSSAAGLPFWPHLEREKGQWDFRTLDDCVKLASEKGVDLIYTMALTPKWAAARNDSSPYGDGPTAAEPKNLDDWRNFVRTVATRYKGKIQYYEIWNEPNLKHFFSGSIDQLVTLAREAYTIIKEVDPAAKVVSPSLYSDYGALPWLDEYFAKGGGNYADIIGAHFYIANDKPPEESLPLIRKVQQVIAKHKLEQKPFWNTETGYGNKQDNAFYSDEQSMAYVARMYLLNWASGIERFYWYAWDNRNVVTMLMVKEDNQTLTGAAKAYGEIQKWLVGSQMKKCQPDFRNTWTCELVQESGKPAWVVWNSQRDDLSFKVPENYEVQQVQNLYGEKTELGRDRILKIGSLPVLLSQ